MNTSGDFTGSQFDMSSFKHIDLRTLHYWNDLIATIASFISNYVLLYLILFKTTDELRPYSRILLQTCILDIFLATCTFLVKLQIEFKDGIFLLMVSGVLAKVPHMWNFLLICLFVFAMYFNISALPIQFYYRERTMSYVKFFACFVAAIIISLGFAVVFAISTVPTNEKMVKFTYLVDSKEWWDEEKKPPIFIAGDVTDCWLIIMVTYAAFIASYSYIMIAYFSWRIWDTLQSSKDSTSYQEQEMQRQFTIALVAQAIGPLFTAVLPIFTAIACILTRSHIHGLGLFIMMAIAWITFINPTCVFLAVAPYRSALFSWTTRIFPDTHQRPYVIPGDGLPTRRRSSLTTMNYLPPMRTPMCANNHVGQLPTGQLPMGQLPSLRVHNQMPIPMTSPRPHSAPMVEHEISPGTIFTIDV